jgi:hypothetical protein
MGCSWHLVIVCVSIYIACMDCSWLLVTVLVSIYMEIQEFLMGKTCFIIMVYQGRCKGFYENVQQYISIGFFPIIQCVQRNLGLTQQLVLDKYNHSTLNVANFHVKKIII